MHDFSSRREEFPFGGSGGSSPRDSRARRRSKQRFDDDEPTTFKRVRGRRALPPIEDWDATDGLPEGDRWSTWDQTQNLVPSDVGQGTYTVPRARLCLATLLWVPRAGRPRRWGSSGGRKRRPTSGAGRPGRQARRAWYPDPMAPRT
jgi:hypothetical protein